MFDSLKRFFSAPFEQGEVPASESSVVQNTRQEVGQVADTVPQAILEDVESWERKISQMESMDADSIWRMKPELQQKVAYAGKGYKSKYVSLLDTYEKEQERIFSQRCGKLFEEEDHVPFADLSGFTETHPFEAANIGGGIRLPNLGKENVAVVMIEFSSGKKIEFNMWDQEAINRAQFYGILTGPDEALIVYPSVVHRIKNISVKSRPATLEDKQNYQKLIGRD